MSRQLRLLLVLGLVMALGIAAALWLVMRPAVDEVVVEPTPGDEPAAVADEEADEAESGGRRRAIREGTAVIFGEVFKDGGQTAAGGQPVLLIGEAIGELETTTTPEGVFRFEKVAAGGPYEVRVVAAGFATVRLPGIALDDHEERDLGTLLLDEAVQLEVLVRSLADAPIAGADVLAYAAPELTWGFDWTKMMAQLGQEPVAVATAKTDAQGRALFPELAAGVWTVVAQKDGFARRGRSGQRLRPKEERGPLVIYLGRGYELKGNVLDGDGQPIAGALILAGRPNDQWNLQSAPLRSRAVAGDDGAYAFGSLDAGDISLMAALPGGTPGQIAILRIPQVPEFDVVLRAGGTLKGTVTMLDSEEPVAGATVSASSWGPGGGRWEQTETDEEGKYEIASLPEGTVNNVTITKEALIQHFDTAQRWVQLPLRAGETAVRDFQMTTGGGLTGVISGADGPLAGARVTVQGGTPQRGWETKNATTDAEGRYAIKSLRPGKYLVQAQKTGFHQKDFPLNAWMALQSDSAPEEYTAEIESGAEATRDITLGVGGVVTGRVENQDGEPVKGARISVGAQNNWWGWNTARGSTSSGEDGTFRLEGVTSGVPLTITVTKEGLVQLAGEPVTVPEDEPLSDVVVVMKEAAVVRGIVRSDSGDPVPESYVQVTLIPEQQNGMGYNPMQQMQAQERYPVKPDGSYEVPITISKGQFSVRADAPDHVPVVGKPVKLEEGKDEYEVDLSFAPGHAISGRVQSERSGEGIAAANVTITASSGGNPGMRNMGVAMPAQPNSGAIVAVTDATGAFAVQNLAVGGYQVNANSYGFVNGTAKASVPASGEVLVNLSPEMEIAGTVAYGDGKGAEGVWVAAARKGSNAGNNFNPGYGGNNSAMTDAAGRFQIRGLGSGTFVLSVTAGWQSTANVRPFTSEPVDAGNTKVRLVAREGLKISGRIVDEAGEPVTSAWVNANPMKPKSGVPNQWRNAQVKEDGKFEVLGLDAESGNYRLNVNVQAFGGKQYTPVNMPDVAPGTTGLEITMKTGLTIEGDIVDDSGKPLTGNVWVMANPIKQDGEQDNRNGANSMADPKGHFKVAGLQPGRYRLSVNSWGPGGNRQLVLDGGQDVAAGSADLKLTATTGATITGSVVDEHGAAVPNVYVYANPQGGGQGSGAQSKQDGTFEITSLQDGVDYAVNVNAQGRIGTSLKNVSAGSSGIQLTVRQGVTVSGRLLAADGTAMANANVWLQPDKDQGTTQNQNGRTNEDGDFEIAGLEDGVVYRVNTWAQSEGGGWSSKAAGTVTAPATNITVQVASE